MQIKFALLKQYCMNVSFFFSLKMADLTLRDHPVIDQMVAGKESLNKLKAVEEKFRTRIDKFAMSDENDILEMTEEKKIPKSKSSVKPEPTSTPKEKAKKSAKTIDISTKPTTSSTKKIVINHTPTTSTKTSTKTEPASTDSAKSTTTTSKVVKKPFEPKPTKKPANTPKTTKSLASPKQMKPSTGKSIFTVTKPQTTPTSPPPKAEPSEIQTTSTSPLPPPANNKPVRATAFDLDDIIEDLDDEEVDYQKAESSQKNYAGMSYAVSALEQTSAAPQRSADVDIPLPLDKKMKSIKRVKEEAKKTK
ncbi:hypothetical protein Pelo_19109 [Pelomyxa schiedti]|nr:hypothetical protein Pelo_19109 [Pelomyxa schiedti]